MNNFFLKFNHGVEIGAHLAYLGHFKRTGDVGIFQIAADEVAHKITLESVLKHYNDKPSKVIDTTFSCIGNIIFFLCRFCPLWSLNFVARSLEMFAVINYKFLAKKYPKFETIFLDTAEKEDEHCEYFKGY